MAAMDCERGRLLDDWQGKPDIVDEDERVLMQAVIRCLRPGSTSAEGMIEMLPELEAEGYGLPRGVGWWEEREGAVEVVSNRIPRAWRENEWRVYVQENWPRVINFRTFRQGRGRLIRREPWLLDTAGGEILYIVPTLVENGDMMQNQLSDEWETRVLLTFYGEKLNTVTKSFRRNETLQELVRYVRTWGVEEQKFHMIMLQGVLMTSETDGEMLLGVVFRRDCDVNVIWGMPEESGEQEKMRQRMIARLYADVQHAMEPVAHHLNVLDVFLEDSWNSFYNRDRTEFCVSPSLVVNLKNRTEDGEIVDIGGVDGGGPSRAFLSRLMKKAGELRVMVGPTEERLLNFNLHDYRMGTYEQLGMAIGLSMACGGAAPTFISREMACVMTEGIGATMGRLGRRSCLNRGFIDVETSEQISRLEKAEDEDHLRAAMDDNPFLAGWRQTDVRLTGNLAYDRGMVGDLALMNAVVGCHQLAYEQLSKGLGRIELPIKRTAFNREGFRQLCLRGNVITLDEFMQRVDFHGERHWGGTSEGSEAERLKVHAWLRRYVFELSEQKVEGVTVADLHEAITGQQCLVTSPRQVEMVLNIGTQCNNEMGGKDVGPLRLTKFVTCGTLMLIQLPCESYEELERRTTTAINMSSPVMIIDRMDRVFRLREADRAE